MQADCFFFHDDWSQHFYCPSILHSGLTHFISFLCVHSSLLRFMGHCFTIGCQSSLRHCPPISSSPLTSILASWLSTSTPSAGLLTEADQKSNRKREREESAAAAAEEAGNKRKEMKRARVIIPTGAWDVTVTLIVTVTAMRLFLMYRSEYRCLLRQWSQHESKLTVNCLRSWYLLPTYGMPYYSPLLPGRPKSILRCGHPAHRPKVHPSWRWKTHSKELRVLHSWRKEGCLREAQRVSIVPDTHWPSIAVTFMNTPSFYVVYRFLYHLISFHFSSLCIILLIAFLFHFLH